MNLWGNREFALLETGRLLSTLGTQASVIAYPLLVLALTHSPAKAGLVAFARLIPQALLGLVAGVAADRVDRKWLMLAADAVRASAVGLLGALVAFSDIPWWLIPALAFVEGTGATFFAAAQPGALRAVVPAGQLPTAVGLQEARGSVVRLAGPALGGALFGLGRAVPFLFDAMSYAFSFLSLLLMRTTFGELREPRARNLRLEIREGFQFVWTQPFIRASTLIYGLGNFLMPGVLLALVVIGRRQGLSGGEIGALVAVLGASTLIGSLTSPLFRRALPVRGIMLLEFWTWLGCWVFVVRPSVWALLAVVIPFGIAAPVTDSVVVGYRVAITPDRLLGRVESVRRTIALLIAPLGPLLAGVLLEHVSARETIGVFAVGGLALAVWGTGSPSLRAAPDIRMARV